MCTLYAALRVFYMSNETERLFLSADYRIVQMNFVRGGEKVRIIVGLGNPGKQYENTKHNVGFLTIDILAEKLGIRVSRIKHKALVGEGFAGGQKVLLVKPQTYMNLSGESVREVLSFYKADPQDLIVIYDDIDIPLGSLRIRKKGSAGTHNGMRSVIYQIVSDDFPRVRIGIGGERKGDLADYVISGFQSSERKIAEDAILRAADAVICMLEKGIDVAMGEYNTRKEKKKREKVSDDKLNDELETGENKSADELNDKPEEKLSDELSGPPGAAAEGDV